MTATANVRTLRNDYARLIALAERGHSITILRHGRPVARLVPPDPPKPAHWSKSAAFSLKQPPVKNDAALRQALDDNKGRY